MKLKQIILIIFISILLISCSTKKPIRTFSAVILFKTPKMKFYDLGFIKKYDNYIDLNILNASNTILKLDIYKNKICKSTLKCISSKEFNKEYLSTTYKDSFLYDLFSQKKVYFKDKKNSIFIKMIKD